MTDRTNADFFQVLLRQARQDPFVYLVLAERSLILSEAKVPQPTIDIHESAPPLLATRIIFRPKNVCNGSGRIEARIGLRMMPTFPRSPLSFRTASFPQYGWKADCPSGAFLGDWRLKPAPGIHRPPSSLHPLFVHFVVATVVRSEAKVGNPKIALVAYGLAIGFILVVAFHSPSKTLITASVPTLMPVADLK